MPAAAAGCLSGSPASACRSVLIPGGRRGARGPPEDAVPGSGPPAAGRGGERTEAGAAGGAGGGRAGRSHQESGEPPQAESAGRAHAQAGEEGQFREENIKHYVTGLQLTHIKTIHSLVSF